MKKVKVRLICGDSYVSKPALLSENGEYLFVSWQNSVYGYSVKTGKRVKEFRGIKNGLLNFDYCCKDGKEVIVSASMKGNVYIWDVATTALLQRVELGMKLAITDFRLIDISVVKEEVTFRCITIGAAEGRKRQIYLYDSATEKIKRAFFLLPDDEFKYAIGGDLVKYMVLVRRNEWHFRRFGERVESKMGLISKECQFTAVACHPTEECALVGDSTGKILLIQGFSEKLPTKAKYHWHSLPVKAIAFSPSGTSFFSGGSEGVLVKWSLDDEYNREFLPRLPEALVNISVSADNSHVAVSTADNAVHVLNPQFQKVQLVQQFFRSATKQGGLIYDERSKCLVFNSISGHVQFFRPHDSTLLHSLDIVGQNRVTGERDIEIQTAEVTGIAFSKNGLWLGTVEQRLITDLDKEIKLKFWFYNKVDQKYHLKTAIDFPHTERVTKIQFQPSNKEASLKCVTISEDRKFKVWEMVHVKTIYRESYSWKCIGAAYYKDLTPLDLCFSSDSSLLAVGFGPILTTWLPDTCELKCSLLHPSQHRKNLTFVAFGNGNQCHLVAAATLKEVSVWNLLSLAMLWTVQVDVSLLIASPYTNHMVVFTKNNKLFLFEPQNSKPLYVNDRLINWTTRVHSAVFARNANCNEMGEWYSGAQLYILDAHNNIYCVEPRNKVEVQDVAETDIKSSIFKYMQPSHKASSLQEVRPVVHNKYDDSKAKSKRIQDFLDTPVHTMPPIRMICKSILDSFI